VFHDSFLKTYAFGSKRVIAVTAHRRENIGKPFENIFSALRDIADAYPDVDIIYPVHLNPVVQETANTYLGRHERIFLINPLDVEDMHNLMARAYFIMTDSGGLQEEAPSLGKPVLVLRNETERPEAVKAGTVRLSGTGYEGVFREAKLLLDSQEAYMKMARAVNPYGDGRASERIADAIAYAFGLTAKKPDDFDPGKPNQRWVTTDG
jgi:UDP-N-acetylglucosamine 2-epimerase